MSRLRTFFNADHQSDRSGALISRNILPGFGMDTRWNGFLQLRYIDDAARSGDQVLARRRFGYIAQASPSRRIPYLGVNGTAGQEIDFANSRRAIGTTINLSATLDPTDHLDLSLVQLSYAGGEVPETNIGLLPALVPSYDVGSKWKNAEVGNSSTRHHASAAMLTPRSGRCSATSSGWSWRPGRGRGQRCLCGSPSSIPAYARGGQHERVAGPRGR